MLSLIRRLLGLDYNKAEISNAIKSGALLVDVRTKEEYAQGHVSGSINIPLNNVVDHLDQFRNQTSVIVFCASGNRSSTAKMILQQNKIRNVINGRTWKDINQLINQL